MAKAELGEKQVCPNCGAKFYDLTRRPATCPKCQTSFDPAEEGAKVKRSRSRSAAFPPGYDDEEEETEAKKKTAEGEDDEEEEVETAPEIDAVPDDPVVLDEEEEAEASPDALPPGFSEEEADLEDDDAADDDVPLLDDEEEFPEDAIGELPAEDEDESGSR
ncbi:MAG: TIGR02300 family protein [Terricaulis sp.]